MARGTGDIDASDQRGRREREKGIRPAELVDGRPLRRKLPDDFRKCAGLGGDGNPSGRGDHHARDPLWRQGYTGALLDRKRLPTRAVGRSLLECAGGGDALGRGLVIRRDGLAGLLPHSGPGLIVQAALHLHRAYGLTCSTAAFGQGRTAAEEGEREQQTDYGGQVPHRGVAIPGGQRFAYNSFFRGEFPTSES